MRDAVTVKQSSLRLPIVPHWSGRIADEQRSEVCSLADQIRRETPELQKDERFRSLVPQRLAERPALHLDDLSEICYLGAAESLSYLQERARLRAMCGDCVAYCGPRASGVEDYFETRLGLGEVHWLYPEPVSNVLKIAQACWEDRNVRRDLLRRIRSRNLFYIHPHMGTLGVWELADLLSQASHRQVEVIAPPPALSHWTNDKLAFADVVHRLFGREFVPRTEGAWNLGAAARIISQVAKDSQVIALKRPDSAGGDAMLALDASRFRGRSLEECYRELELISPRIGWDESCELLIGQWETNVLCSPSVQTWIPPRLDGEPVIEGVFIQQFRESTGIFEGATAGDLPARLTADIASYSWLLAYLFQQLGYIGRCSFDLLLVGDSLETSRMEFIECNGRWGGTSLPMTMMNRLFGDWQNQPYSARVIRSPELSQVQFDQLLVALDDELYDRKTGRGWLMLYCAGHMHTAPGITALALAPSWEAAQTRIDKEVPALLRHAVSRSSAAR